MLPLLPWARPIRSRALGLALGAVASCGMFPAGAAQAQPVLRPVDEAARRADFFSFRARLQAAIARRDAGAVIAVLDPHVKISFGDDNGRAAFERRWRPRDPDSPLWAELGRTLALGGSFQGERFVAPYVFSEWPNGSDSFADVAVIGAAVRVRDGARGDAPVLRTVSFAVLRREGPAKPGAAAWTAVRLPDGRTGHVATEYVRSPLDYRVIFERGPAGWRMTAFVAGD